MWYTKSNSVLAEPRKIGTTCRDYQPDGRKLRRDGIGRRTDDCHRTARKKLETAYASDRSRLRAV